MGRDPAPASSGASAGVESVAEDVEELGAACASEDEVSRAVDRTGFVLH